MRIKTNVKEINSVGRTIYTRVRLTAPTPKFPQGEVMETGEFMLPTFAECIGKIEARRETDPNMIQKLHWHRPNPHTVLIKEVA